MMAEIHDLEGDMFTFCEHNLQVNRHTMDKIYQATKKVYKHKASKINMKDNPIPTASNFKPGGTGQVITNHLTGRIEKVSTDKLGRWVATTYHGRHQPITVISAYAPTASISSSAKATNTMQQRTYFEKLATDKGDLTAFQEINNQTPRKLFEEELLQEIQNFQKKEHEIILLGDFNDTIHSKKSFIQRLIRKVKLVDIWDKEHPDETEPATYYRGKHRIDHCLISPNLANSVENILYTPFFTIANSDHAGIILDIQTNKLFPKRNDNQMYHDRGLFSNDYKQLPKYIQKVYDHLNTNNVFNKMKQLQELDYLDVEAIEKIDKTVSQACATGEKSIKKRQKPWWSIELHEKRYTLNVVHKAINHIKNGKFNRTQLQLQLDQHQCSTELPTSLKDLLSLKKNLKEELSEIIEKDRERRDDYLSSHAQKATSEGNEEKANTAKALQHTEKLNRAFKIMSAIRKPRQQNGVTMITIPDSWGTPDEAIANPETLEDSSKATKWKQITDDTAIKKYMLARNRKHFHQAYGTPLTLPPWPDLLDWAGSSPIAQNILEGKFDTKQLPVIQATIMKQCRKEFEQPLIHPHLTTASMTSKLKNWKETTSTSPSGRHLGHYRAMVQSMNFLTDAEERDKLEDYQQQIITLYTNIINYATRFGYILQRWRIIESTMIPKDIGNTKIHRLRVIHIFEADYNLLLGVKWREIIWKLENNGALHPGQHGSRPGHQATDLTLLEELTFDISRCSRTAIGNFDNDASACYDRVVAEFSSLASLSHGHHPSLIKLNTQALKSFKYYIRNTTKDNNAYYQHQDQYPIYGTGQGCANSPTVWCLVSSTLFKAHQQASNGSSFCSPDQSLQETFSMVGFVDDSTGRVNKFKERPQPSARQLTDLMSHDAQCWHDALDFSGGKLELPKCSYHLLSYQFLDDGRAIPVEKPNLPDLHVRNQSQSVPIRRMSVFQSHKTLGHWKAPAGKGVTNLAKLQEKANKIANQINSSQLTRTFIWLMYLSIYVSAVKYTLPQNFYTKQELIEAQRRSMRTIIGTCGFSRNTSLKVLYGPTHLGGSGFLHWYTLQGEGQILNFIQHWRASTDIGNMLRIAVAWAQHFAGTSQLFLNDHQKEFKYVPAKWLIALREFLIDLNGTIQIYKPPVYPLQRQQDQHLMEIAHQSGKFTSGELELLNFCRIHLQVTVVSDISVEDGSRLQSAAYHGPRSALYSSSKWLYPEQPKPKHTTWSLWLRLLDIIASPSSKLHQPLGPWLHSADKLTCIWNEYRHRSGDHQYIQQKMHKHLWLRMDRVRKTWHRSCIVRDIPFQELFPCARPTDLAASLSMCHTNPPPSISSTFAEFLNTQPATIQQFLAHIELFTDPFTIIQKLQQESSNFLTTDGASLPLRTAYGWVLATDDESILAEGNGPAAGASTSYRAEAYGLHAGVQFLQLLCDFTNQSFEQLDIFCDNKSIIQKAEARHYYTAPFPTSTTTAEWDQLEMAYSLICQMHLDVAYHHVRGHQDDVTSELDFTARMNVQADFLAGDFIYNNVTPHPTVPVNHVNQCHLQIGQHTITSNYRQEIRDAASAPALRHHILTFCGKDTTVDQIDWNIFSTANQRLKQLRVWSTKFIYNLLPTVRPEKTFTYDRPRCLHCPACVDTWTHHLSCPETSRRQLSTVDLQNIRQYLHTIHTCPDLLPIIMTGLRTFYLQQDPAFGRHQQLFCLQERIGWINFAKGIWHKAWCLAQDSYLKETHQYSVSSNGTLWALKVITFLRENIHARWIHHTHAIHNPPDAPSATKQRLLNRIQHLQSQYSQCCPHYTHQFFIDTTSHHHTVTSLQNWLTLHATVLEKVIVLHRKNSLLSQSLITRYFS